MRERREEDGLSTSHSVFFMSLSPPVSSPVSSYFLSIPTTLVYAITTVSHPISFPSFFFSFASWVLTTIL